MALTSTTVWEVRTSGNDANGGGFRWGSSGTDYSQQDLPQLSVTDATAAGTPTLSSSTGGFTAAMVGNIAQIGGGTLAAGFYEITGYINAGSITLDRSPGSGGGSTFKVGGALASPAKVVAAMVSGNTVWIKNGLYTLSNATLSLPSWSTPNPTVINGYNGSRGDLEGVMSFANYPTIQKSAGSESIFSFTSTGTRVRSLILDGNGLAANGTVGAGGTAAVVEFCKATGCTSYGFGAGGNFNRCLSTANLGSAGGFYSNGAGTYVGCVASSNPGPGFTVSNNTLIHCVSQGNTGSSGHGFSNTGGNGPTLLNCVALSNAGDGLRIATMTAVMSAVVRNCIFSQNGGFGVSQIAGGQPSSWAASNHNAFYNNASGARGSLPASLNDVTLTSDPFVNASGGNLGLTLGSAGAQCRAAGYPGTLPGGQTVGSSDIGVAQHADPVSGGQARVFGSGVIVGKGVRP